jgi:hypothetical protein
VSSLEIYAQVATKSGKSTRKSRILSLSKNTLVSGLPLHPDPGHKNPIKKKTNFTVKLISICSF